MLRKCFQVAVELVKFNDVLKSNHELMLIYNDFEGKEKNSFRGNLDLYKKLCKVLYEKTGMIFLADAYDYNIFLPSTFRELTHFVKMLDELENVSSDLLFVYENNILSESSKAEIDKILRNIGRIKQYYIVNWLPSHTTESGQKELEEKATQPISAFKNEINEMCQATSISESKKSPTNDQLKGLFELTEWYIRNHEGKEKYNKYDEAIKIYYTIALNELYYHLMKDNAENKIHELLMDSFGINDELGNKEYNGLYIYKYGCEDELVRSIIYQDGVIPEDKKEWMEYYCDNNGYTTVNVFNFFIKALEKPYMLLEDDNSVIENNIVEPQSTEDVLSPGIRKRISSGSSKMIAIRNILLNFDVQEKLSGVIKKELSQRYNSSDKIKLSDIYSNLASCMEKWLETSVDFANFDTSVVEYALCKGNNFCEEFLLCNKHNRDRLMRIIGNKIVPQYESIASRLSKCTSAEMARNILATRVEWDIIVDREVLLNSHAGTEEDLLDDEIKLLKEIEDRINEVKEELDDSKANEDLFLKKVNKLVLALSPLIETIKLI